MEIIVNLDLADAAIRKIVGSLPEKTRAAFVATGQTWVRRMTTERLRGRPGLIRRTGAGAKALFYNASATALVVGTDTSAPYLPVHEGDPPGTPVVIKGKPWLWIPTKDNKTPAGVTRLSPKDAFATLGKKDLYWITAKSGNRMLMSRSKGPLFTLVSKVTIPARLGANAMLREMPPVFVEKFTALVQS